MRHRPPSGARMSRKRFAGQMKPRKILFIYANPLSPEKKHLPYGLIWMSQNLQDCDVRIVDAFMEYPADPFAGVRKEIADHSPDLIGIGLRNIDSQTSIELKKGNFSPPDGSFKTIYLMPEIEKLVSCVNASTDGRNIPVIVGGGGFQAAPAAVLKSLGLRYGITGPGEGSFNSFVGHCFNGGPMQEIAGLVEYLGDDSFRETPRRYYPDGFCHFVHLDTIPENLKVNLEQTTVGVKTRYGCPGRCSYCLDPRIEGSTVRYRDMDDIFRQLIEYTKDVRINKIHFTDPEFNMPDLEFSTVILKEIVRRGFDYRFAFSSQFVAAPMTRQFAGLLYKANLRDFGFTIDSVNDDVLRMNGRRCDARTIRENIDICIDNGIFLMINFIVGMYGETRESLEEVIDFCRSYEKAPLQFSFVFGLRIYEQTPLGRMIDGDLGAFSPHVYGKRTFQWLEPCYFSAPRSPYENYLYFHEHLGSQKNVVM